MFKFSKTHGKVITLAFALAMLVCSMLALTASAHEEDDGIMPLLTCGCSNPSVDIYRTYHTDSFYDGCRVGLREYCTNCHWHYEYEAAGYGSMCHPYSTLQQWPTKWDKYL
ncbi:MAG: hypothetical protein HFE63_02810 [Clostridiales bacterium]|nr:hypothetical protein [Clostridiales bacterium]